MRPAGRVWRSVEGCARKERAVVRRDDQLTHELERQDRLISGLNVFEIEGEAAIAEGSPGVVGESKSVGIDVSVGESPLKSTDETRR